MTRRRGSRRGLDLGDRLDKVLVDRHEVRSVFVVDEDVGQTDEEACLFVDGVGDAIPHRWNQEVSHVGTTRRTNTDTNFLALGHNLFLLPCGPGLRLSSKKLLALAQLLVFVLAHLFPAFLQHTRHVWLLLGGGV